MEKVWSEKVREMEYAAYYLKLQNERRAGERAGELRERKKTIQRFLDQGQSIHEIAAFYQVEDSEITEILNWKPEEELSSEESGRENA